MEAPAMPHARPSLRVAFWGSDGLAVNQVAAAEIALHVQAWHAEQRRRAEVDQLAALIRDALVERLLSPGEVMGLLVTAPPPERSRRERIAAALRLLACACFPHLHRRGSSHDRKGNDRTIRSSMG